MTTDASNVAVPITGAVSRGAVDALAPTDATTALGTGWDGDLGYLSEDGITEARARDSEEIKAFQNGDTIRTVVTGSTLTYQFVALETKATVLEAYYGVTVDATDGSVTVNGSETGGRRPWNFDYEDGDISVRAYAPQGEVTEVGDQVWANGQPIGYDMTVTCYPDTSITTLTGKPGAVRKWFSNLAPATP